MSSPSANWLEGLRHANTADYPRNRPVTGGCAQFGMTGQFSAIDEFHTGRENLTLMADLNHLERVSAKTVIDELLERFELADAAGRRAQTYSGGMNRRLDLAMTLLGSPRLIALLGYLWSKRLFTKVPTK